MGLLDVLNGMRNGPRRRRRPSASGGMSPITMAILALLAYKGIKHTRRQRSRPASAAPGGNHARMPGRQLRWTPARAGGGGSGRHSRRLARRRRGGAAAGRRRRPAAVLGDLLKGGLGGLLAGGAAGSILSGGLGDLLKQFQENGQGDVAKPGSARDRTRTSRKAIWRSRSAATTSTRCASHRPVARRAAAGPAPRTARRDRRADAGRPRADRARGVALGVTVAKLSELIWSDKPACPGPTRPPCRVNSDFSP